MSRSEHIIAAVTGATIAGIFGLIVAFISNHSPDSPQPGPSRSSSPQTITPTTPGPKPVSSPIPSPSQKLNISVACKIPRAVHEGERITAIYSITSNRSVKVGLGAGVYDSGGNDHSTGTGDEDGYQLTVGSQAVTRIIVLPTGLSADQYEIDAEIWPNGDIGATRANVLAEATCGFFNVS
jgi:hypothetical protein